MQLEGYMLGLCGGWVGQERKRREGVRKERRRKEGVKEILNHYDRLLT